MKKTLAILLALVMCLGIVALVACDPDDNSDVPVAEGKVTLYFSLAEDSVELAEYASVFYAGGQTAWAKGLAAPEFKKVEGKNLYYAQIEYDATKEQANEYALVLGYNKSSGLPDDKCGLAWIDAYKSDYCATFAYGTNATFEYKDGAKTVNLGEHKFSTAISAPIRVNTELRLTFSQALGENAEVYFMGDFNGWTASAAQATASADRTVYSLALNDVLCSNYGYKVLVVRDKTAATTTEGEGDDATELGIWDWNMTTPEFPADVEHDDNSVIRAYIEIGASDGGNLTLSVMESDGGSYIDLLETVSEAYGDVDKTGLDLNQIDLQEGENNGTPNNVFTWKYQMELPEKTFIVNFKEALSTEMSIYILGSMNGWNEAYNADAAKDKSKMTISADRKSASIALEVAPGNYECNVIAIRNDYEIANGGSLYGGIKLNGNSNLPVTVTGYDDEDIELFEEALDTPYIAPSIEVTCTVTFASSMTGKVVVLKGSMIGWGEVVMTSTDGLTFTATITTNPGTHAFLLGIGDTEAAAKTYATKVGANGAYGAGDASVTIAVTDTTVQLFENAVAAPAA
ncbi:MAG: hypothetical protein NC099_00130 [Corallococcus sp.]|nr:hypothetical protein [Corallococcus sp.]